MYRGVGARLGRAGIGRGRWLLLGGVEFAVYVAEDLGEGFLDFV